MISPLTLTFIREDYAYLLKRLGLSDAQVRASRNDFSDHINQPVPDYRNFSYGRSQIEGIGTFAKRTLVAGDYIGTMNRDGYRTMLGRSVNHSPLPNARAEVTIDGITLFAASTIAPGVEITVDYRNMPAVRAALGLTK